MLRVRSVVPSRAVVGFFRNGKGEAAMHTLRLGSAALVAGLWLLTACGSHSTSIPPAPTADATETRNIRSSDSAARCKSDSECPSGRRCGFTGAIGCEGYGTCVVPGGSACFDPGGRCGCDGRPVDLFCAKGSSSEFASAPVGFVGPCPIPCTEGGACPPRLVCENGFCGKPQDGGQKPKQRNK